MKAFLRKAGHWAVRLAFLAAAVVLMWAGPLPVVASRIFPSLSPYTVFAGAIASRSWALPLLWGVPALVMLLLALFKGRFFCRWICPAGTLFAIPSRLSLKRTLLVRRINGYVFWMVVAASVVGAPLFIFLDPLSSFNRFSLLLRGTYMAAALVPGALIPLFLLLGFIQPMIWCSSVCPLGYALGKVRLGQKSAGGEKAFDRTRREILVGAALGLPLAVAARFLPASRLGQLPILPPGARDVDTFANICSRCYACVNACPTNVIRVDVRSGRSLLQAFQPELDMNQGYCDEFCNNCSHVCPTGAILPVAKEKKKKLQIGVAKVNRDACLAWAEEEYCMVCAEFCPYQAINDEPSENGIPRPVVDPNICRGCGSCQRECPAIKHGKAIIVSGVRKQKFLDV